MNIYVENSKTNVINLKEVWLSKGYDLIFNPEDLAAVFNGDEKMIREFIDKCNGKVSENGSIHFKNIESAIEFENEMKNKYSDVLIISLL